MLNYNSIAPIYDLLKNCVFGKPIFKIQKAQLSEIQQEDLVLVIGGGTGYLLEHLHANVDYVDSSYRMIRSAQRRDTRSSVTFHCCRLEELKPIVKYDYIISDFFLDLFSDEDLAKVIDLIKSMLRITGRLIVKDFGVPKTCYQSWLSYSMHTFFRLTTQLKRKRFADLESVLLRNGFKLKDQVFVRKGFINSWVFSLR
ncbi:class I SAM-dependent methyltransferase [Reichenbachiella versicolor]|uniref:class I SAM-dependent methyltransferase n=1 Tax=Reichenbachiella versicolor TaxID=1821036 RepID=UPI000D6E8437|nr:class I SAM-dependent methyltransferase [Reichenbachiella versicolor]